MKLIPIHIQATIKRQKTSSHLIFSHFWWFSSIYAHNPWGFHTELPNMAW